MQRRNRILWFVLLSLVSLAGFAQSRPYAPHVVGATDVVYADWSRRFGAPPAIFR